MKSFIISAVYYPLHFAYSARRGVEDAKLFLLDKLYKYLELTQSHAGILVADFCSAFNTMQYHILAQKLIKKKYSAARPGFVDC